MSQSLKTHRLAGIAWPRFRGIAQLIGSTPDGE